MKFGVVKYSKDFNIGNDFQQYACERLLPHVDFRVEQTRASLVGDSVDLDPCLLVINGWCVEEWAKWPPRMPSIYVGAHLRGPALRCVEHLRACGPIGCRDKGTLTALRELKVPTYYSGCLTLTLPKEKVIQRKSSGVLLVDMPADLTWMPERVRQGTRVSHRCESQDPAVRRARVLELLELYRSAELIVTTRVHCALPNVAFRKPVVFFGKETDQRHRDLKQYMPVNVLGKCKTWNPEPADVSLLKKEMRDNFYTRIVSRTGDEW